MLVQAVGREGASYIIVKFFNGVLYIRSVLIASVWLFVSDLARINNLVLLNSVW